MLLFSQRPPTPDCTEIRAAYDIGSGSIKTIEARVNTRDNVIVEILHKQNYSVPFRSDLEKNADGSFSMAIKNQAITVLTEAKAKYSQAKQHCAVATAAFRSAKNGESFAKELEEALAIPVTVVSQTDEGRLAYESAMSQVKNPMPTDIVWDIGAGSMQFSFKDAMNGFHMVGNEVASQTFKTMVLKKIMHKAEVDTPNPMSKKEIEAAINLAKECLKSDSPDMRTMQKEIDQGAQVYAVGPIHNVTLLQTCNKMTGKNNQYYTKEDLSDALQLCANKTDQELQELFKEPLDFIQGQVTTMILVYAQMTALGINKVNAIDTGNVEELLLDRCYRRKSYLSHN